MLTNQGWEYLEVKSAYRKDYMTGRDKWTWEDNPKDTRSEVQMLNDLGAQGWELVDRQWMTWERRHKFSIWGMVYAVVTLGLYLIVMLSPDKFEGYVYTFKRRRQ